MSLLLRLILPYVLVWYQRAGLETLIGKPVSAPEFIQLQQETAMEELLTEQRVIDGKVVDRCWIFKGADYHCRVRAANRKGGELLITQLEFYKPGKSSPKVKGKPAGAPLPFGMSWNMTESQLRQQIGNSRDTWVRYGNYNLQCGVFADKSNMTLQSLAVQRAVDIKYNPAPVTTKTDHYPPPTMVKLINTILAGGWYEHTRKIVPFPAPTPGQSTVVDIPFTTPERWEGNLYLVTTENTIGGYVFFIDDEGKKYSIDPVPGNDSYALYDPKNTIPPGRNFTIRVMSDGTNSRSIIVVYGFGKNRTPTP